MFGNQNKKFDYIEKIKKSATITDTIKLVRSISQEYGYSYFCLSEIPSPDAVFRPHHYDNWPAGWTSFYLEKELFKVDPVLRALRSAMLPLDWSDAFRSDDSNDGAQMMRLASSDWVMRLGYAVPIYSLSGTQAALSFCADQDDVDPEGKPALHLISMYAHAKLEELSRRAITSVRSNSTLSRRERECLQYAAAGKTNEQTSIILNITERTVRAHIESATVKLGARNRTQAVANALRLSLI